MRYQLAQNSSAIILSIEASFTLIDYLMFFVCFILGFIFALFFWIFAVGILAKLFTRYDFEFNSDTYRITQHLYIFSYIRIKRHVIPFGDVKHIILSNMDSGRAMVERGLIPKEWFTLDIVTHLKRLQLVKAEPDELEEVIRLYSELQELMGEWFFFKAQISETP